MASRRSSRTIRTLITTTAALAVASAVLAVLPATAAPTWLLPPTVLSQDADEPDVAVSSSGEAVVVFLAEVAGQWLVHATVRSPGGTWSAPLPVSDPAYDANSPQVVLDDAGNATAVWTSFEGSGGSPIRAAFRPSGAGWGAPTYVSGALSNALYPQIAVDQAGAVTVAWDRAEGMGTEYIEFAVRPLGGAWSTPVALAADNARSPRVAAGPAGIAAISWVATDSSQGTVMSTVRDVSGAWSDAKAVSSPGVIQAAPVAIDGSGRVLVAWTRNVAGKYVAQVAERPAGGLWSAPTDLSPSTLDASGVEAAVNETGRAVVGWESSDGSVIRVHASIRPTGGSWEPPVPLSADGQDTALGDVGIDPSGAATAVWARKNGTYPVVQAARRPAEGPWTGSPDLTPGTVTSAVSGIAVDDAGDVVVPLRVATAPSRVEVTVLDTAAPVLTQLSAPATGTSAKALTYGAAATDTWSGVASYAWSFGDGSTSTSPAVSHAFAKPGSYPVTLTVTDTVGNSTTRTSTTIVAAPVPAMTTFKLKKKTIATDEKTKLKVRLNTASTLKLVFKSKHKHLVKGKKKYLKVVVKKKLPAGLSKVTVKGKKLKPDTWKLVGTARNSAGTSGKKKTTLVVVRP